MPKGLANIKYVNFATLSRLVALIFAPKKIMSNQVKEMAVRLKPLLNEGDVGCKWESSLDKIFSPGNYVVEIDHTGSNAGLPVKFCGAEHYIVGNLVVTDSGTAGPKQHDRVIGQSLTFTTRESKATKVYTRTYANGRWGEWHSLIEAGAFDKITTTDELISIVAAISNDVNTLKGAGDGSIAAVVGAAVEKGRTLAKRDLFIAAGALYNDANVPVTRRAPWGEDVKHLSGHYYLNGLGDITEDEMAVIYSEKYRLMLLTGRDRAAQQVNVRTFWVNQVNDNIRSFYKITDPYMAFYGCANLEVLSFVASSGNFVAKNTAYMPSISSTINYMLGFVADCPKLKYISALNVSDIAQMQPSWGTIPPFRGCVSLIEVSLFGLKCDVSFADSPNISKRSVLYAIENGLPVTAITIILHAEAYARLAEDTDIVAALEAQPLVSLVSA